MAHHKQQLVEETAITRQIMATSSSSSTLFCYPDVSSAGCHNQNIQAHLVPQLQSFDPNHPDIYNLATGIEMIGFQRKPTSTNPHEHVHDPGLWKGFSSKTTGSGDPGPSKDPNSFYRHRENDGDHGGGGGEEVGGGAYVDESSLGSCVFPCEGNKKPNQGLSLSLSSPNPSTIELQSFELRHHPQTHQRLIMSSLPTPQQQQHEAFLGKSVVASGTTIGPSSMGTSMQIEMMRNSKYLAPTQELLNEICSLGTNDNKQSGDDPQSKRQLKKKEKEHWEFLDGDDGNLGGDSTNQSNGVASSSSQFNLFGLNLLELQKRKTKLLGLLEELDRRYRHYCEQMKGVVASFEAVAGPGAANVYSASASKAMSRHFRSLRDALVGQVKATKKVLGEKDAAGAVPGTTRGETPRLRMLDQALRQQKAYQQMTMMETHPWRPQRGLPDRSVSILRAWLFEHFLHPYPSDVDKHILARQTGLTRSQVSNWFINARVRLWKPMVEQMYLEETKEEQEKNMASSSDIVADHHHQSNEIGGLIQPSNDQKPTPDQLLRVEPESLSSIINTTSTTTAKSDHRNNAQRPTHDSSATNYLQQSQFGRIEAFGSIDLDFPSSSSFHHPHAPYGAQNENNAPQGFGLGGNGGGGNVSLTLGLQQHGGNGVSLAFSPPSQSSLFYARDQIDDCQPVHQYSLLDGDQGQNLPYRNLMGAQLLHDFA